MNTVSIEEKINLKSEDTIVTGKEYLLNLSPETKQRINAAHKTFTDPHFGTNIRKAIRIIRKWRRLRHGNE